MHNTGPVVVANQSSAYGRGLPVRIPVFFHVITGVGGNGNVTRAQILQQVAVLNDSFAGGGIDTFNGEGTYVFELAGISRVENSAWFSSIRYGGTFADGAPERAAKQALAQDPRHILNIYTADLVDGSGFATFPFSFQYPTQGTVPGDEDHYLHGVMADYTTLPGGSHPDYNEGDLIVHEVGHYLGLYHPNNGDCSGNTPMTCNTSGDAVCDTPQLKELTFESRYINAGGKVCDGLIDGTRSFMNYTEDFYRGRFTPGQHERMDLVGMDGRPSLGQPAAPERVSAGVTVTFEPDIAFRYGPGETLTVTGTLLTSGTTLTASDPGQGWGGIRFEPGSVGTLSGVTVSGARWILPAGTASRFLYPPGAAVSVNGATVTLTDGSSITGGDPVVPGTMTPDGGTVFGTNGLHISGATANVTVTGLSRIRENIGLGIVATGGAHVLVNGEADVSVNGFGGIRALGDGTQATVTGYAQVTGNYGIGIQADYRAFAVVRSPSEQKNTSVSGNGGGPTARTAASIDGGQCIPTGATGRPNNFELNTDNGDAYDAAASGGAAVVARYAFWGLNAQGVGRTFSDLLLDIGKSGMVSAGPTAATLGTPDPSCPQMLEGRAAAGETTRQLSSHALTAGRASVTVVALASAAREQAWAGDPDAAFASLDAARAAVLTDDDREAVFGATAALVSDTQPTDLMIALEATASSGTSEAPWARRALGVAYAALGRTAEADAVASSLTGIHAATGHGLRVRLAVDARDELLALARLVAFADDADASADEEALGSSLALVAGAFPDADLSAMPGSLAGRSAGRGMTNAAGRTTTAAASGIAGVEDGLTVYPNPVAGRATVGLALAVPAEHVTASVYDALGRRVAVLQDGPLDAGTHALAFDAAQMPPGVYVVQVRVSRNGDAMWTEVRRITVAR